MSASRYNIYGLIRCRRWLYRVDLIAIVVITGISRQTDMAAVAQLSGLLLSVLCTAAHSPQIPEHARMGDGNFPSASLAHPNNSSEQEVNELRMPALRKDEQSFNETGDSSDDDLKTPKSIPLKTNNESAESPLNKSVVVVDQQSPNKNDKELSNNTSSLWNIVDGENPESYVSEFTTILFMFSEPLEDFEPLYVNLTGIRDFTDRERRVVGGCLDLSDLYITGEEVKEVIRRMSWYRFSRLDLTDNNITEFPASTFAPVALSVRELRLAGNPLRSGSGLQRGGLFHLAELKDMNLSGCGLQNMDLFTPWNSNLLEVMDLSNNNLSTVPTNLQFFHKLKYLYVHGNPITVISELPFALLWNLQVLSMCCCQLTTIHGNPFRNMDRLKQMDLRGNNLTRMSEVRVPHGGSKVLLSDNPWHCGCDALDFLDRFHSAIIDIDDVRCSSPSWLDGLRAAYLSDELLTMDCALYEAVTPALPAPADHLEILALVVFVLAAAVMSLQFIWPKKKDKLNAVNGADDIKYIRVEKTPLVD